MTRLSFKIVTLGAVIRLDWMSGDEVNKDWEEAISITWKGDEKGRQHRVLAIQVVRTSVHNLTAAPLRFSNVLEVG